MGKGFFFKWGKYKYGWLVVFYMYVRPIDSEVIQRRHGHLLSLAKDVKLGKYTVLTGMSLTYLFS